MSPISSTPTESHDEAMSVLVEGANRMHDVLSVEETMEMDDSLSLRFSSSRRSVFSVIAFFPPSGINFLNNVL